MPNYSLVVNSRFRPFSFERYIQPYQIYGQAYREQQDALAALDDLASDLSGKINPDLDKDLYNQYNNFTNKMSEIATELSAHGLTPDSRQKLLSARSRYKKEIEPIKEAYNRKLEDIKRQDMLQDKSNGRMIFNRDARLSPLSDYYNGNVPELAQVNLDHVVNAGVEGGKAISSRYIKTKEGRRFANDYYSLIKQTGIENQNEVLEILKNSGKYPEFSRFYNDTLANYGYDNFDEAGKKTMEAALREGLNRGIVYSEAETLQSNWRAQKAVDHYYHELEAEAAANREINKAAQLARIKAEEDRNSQINNMFAPAVPLGVTGKPDTDLDRVKGLKLITGSNGDIGVSTHKLDALAEEVKEAKKALDNYTKGDRKYELWETNPKTRPTVSAIDSSDYNKWKALKDKADKAKSKFDEEWNYLKGLEKAYSGYGNNMYDRISTGIAARQAHLGQQSLFYGLNADDASYTRLKNSLSRLGTVGASIVDAKSGKQVTGDDLNGANGLLKDENTAIGVITEGDKVFLSLAGKGGKKYTIKGIRHIDDFNERLSYVNRKLGDFYSPRTTGNVYTVPAGFRGGPAEILEAARKAGKAEHPKNTNMYAATVRMPVNGRSELVNIVSDGMGVYYQTLTDELYNKGEFREAVIQNAAATALVDLTPTLAHTLEAKEDEK